MIKKEDEQENESTLVIKSVKFGGSIEVTYQMLNESIDEWEEVKKGFKEMPHPDLKESVDDVITQVMQILGFPNSHPKWGKYTAKELKFGSNNNVSAKVVFTHSTHNMLKLDLPDTIEVPEHVVQACIDEFKLFVKSNKKAQGEIFNFEPEPANYELVQIGDGEDELEKEVMVPG